LKSKDPHPNGIAALFFTPAGNLEISSETIVKDTFGRETAFGGEVGCPLAMFEFKWANSLEVLPGVVVESIRVN
jgi:hypothetical protein